MTTCNQHSNSIKLKRTAINALQKGRHARVGGSSIKTRGKNLAKIAAAYSWSELLEENGIGIETANGIKRWLETQGACLRSSQ